MTEIPGQIPPHLTTSTGLASDGPAQLSEEKTASPDRSVQATIAQGTSEERELRQVNPARSSRVTSVIVNAFENLAEHRRQTAAVVVVVCLVVFWFDSGSTSAPMSNSGDESAMPDSMEEELMLDEFDAIEVAPLREPAEPSDIAASDPFPLTIPQMDSDPAQTQISGQAAGHPQLEQTIDEVRNQSAVQAESTGGTEYSSQQSVDNSRPAVPRSVRFTGRIQPLN